MFDSHFLIAGLTIVLIDLLLAGDNALVIAMAVRSLPPRERRIGSLCGAALAVALRIGLTVVAARVLQVQFVKLAGGLLVLWIAIKVMQDANDPPHSTAAPGSLWKAIWYVLLADLTMSLDNILAIAGAANGHIGLIIFGLGLSIPFVVFSSGLLSKMMDRYPVTIYIGAAILGQVGAKMAITDPFVTHLWQPSDVVRYCVEAVVVIALLFTGRMLCRRPAA